MRTLKRTITLDVEISYKLLKELMINGETVYQIVKISTPELEKICKEIVENEEGFND